MLCRVIDTTGKDEASSSAGGADQQQPGLGLPGTTASDATAANLDHLLFPRGFPSALQATTTRAETADPLDQTRSADVANLRGAITSLIREVLKRGRSFLSGSITDDWAAAPIAMLASVPSSIFTALTVTALTKGLDSLTGGTDTAAFATLSSALAIFVGYASYLPLYWGGMLIKERGDFVNANGGIDHDKFAAKLRVLMMDLLLHVPKDLYTIGAMGVTQSGLLMTGSSDLFWSIIISQSAIDLAYALSEPLYWRAAKQASQAVSGSSLETESKTVQQPD